MEAEKVIVIGGGIGGLAFALALSHLGIPVEVYERAPELKEVGAGLALWSNATKVLKRLGVDESLKEIALPLKQAEVCSNKGRTLSAMNFEPIVEEIGTHCYLVHRGDFIRVIAENLPAGIVKTGHECVKIEQDESGVTAHFANGETAKGSILVGADGINSIVRTHLWNDGKPRYSGQTCFRSVVNFHLKSQTFREIQGAGKRIGIGQLSNDRVYWFAVINAPQGKMIAFEKRRDFLLSEFDGWLYQVTKVIVATPSEKILQNDLVDRVPIKQWSKGRITLIGDAAHPTTPNLGQGACMAIEDAMVLARMLQKHKSHQEAFATYEKERLARTSRIVKMSWTVGRMAGWESLFAVKLRELMARATPAFLMKREFLYHVGYDAGNLS